MEKFTFSNENALSPSFCNAYLFHHHMFDALNFSILVKNFLSPQAKNSLLVKTVMKASNYLLTCVFLSILRSQKVNSAYKRIQRNRLVPWFVGRLTRHAAAIDPLRVHDVVLAKIGNELENEIFDEIARELSPFNVMITFGYLESVQTPIQQPASTIICVADTTDGVIFEFLGKIKLT